MIQNITKHCKTLKGLYQCKTLLNIAKYCRDCNGAKQTGFMLPQATIRRAARCSTAKVAHCYAKKSSWAINHCKGAKCNIFLNVDGC